MWNRPDGETLPTSNGGYPMCRCMILVAATLALTAVMLTGCETADSTTNEPATTQAAMVSPGALDLCRGCGQIKGTDTCCQPGQVTCNGCGLAKGSPGCCRIDRASTEPVALCTGCGHIKGTEMCCQPGQARCSCGMVKGSAGCCKIPADMQN